MAGNGSLKRRRAFWRSDAALALVVTAAVLLAHVFTDAISALERRVYDVASTQAARTPSDRIAIVAIDDRSVAEIGRWPWSREVHAGLLDRLAEGRPKAVVFTTFFFEPQVDRGLEAIRRIRQAASPGDLPEPIARMLSEAEASLDADARLAQGMARAGKVLLPAVFELGQPLGRPDRPLAAAVQAHTLPEAVGYSVPALSVQAPFDLLAQAAAGIGHLNQLSESDGVIRQEPLLVNHYGRAMPSLALLAAAAALNLGVADLQLDPGAAVQLGGLRVPTDLEARMLPHFYRAEAGRPPFAIESFHDVATGRVPASRFTDKIVLVGATAAGVGTTYPVPGHPGLAPVEVLAHATSSILSGHVTVEPSWGPWAALGALLLVAAYLAAGLPRLSAGGGAAATALLLAALVGGEALLLMQAATWVQWVLPAVLLLVGHLALTTRRFLATERGKLRADDESAETNRLMGLSLQGQGQLDMAWDRFRRVPLGDALMENLYNLALDFERKRQFNKAEAVYDHMATWNAGFKDLAQRRNRARNLADTVILGMGAGGAGTTRILGDGQVEKPMLGRYQVERELGKGAMGVVYLGRDPMIGRTVAIKTLELSREFEGTELEDARKRFFREAETAGRLAHPHIVTIFDAGEEHDLAYIAMEFLRGHDLAHHVQPGQLLPPGVVGEIGIRVAEALAYAHRQHVVHRDIKPANIVWDPESGAVKVTDFGIARITDASRTRTGMVLGTPSYMAPEQIAGKPVDGRADLYALAVTLFQLFTGELPFRGDSLAELMFKIANEDAPDLRSRRPELPPSVAAALASALVKRPDGRVPDGEAFAAALRASLPELQALGGSLPPPSQTGDAPAAGSYDPTRPLQAADLAASPGTVRLPTLSTAAARAVRSSPTGADPDA